MCAARSERRSKRMGEMRSAKWATRTYASASCAPIPVTWICSRSCRHERTVSDERPTPAGPSAPPVPIAHEVAESPLPSEQGNVSRHLHSLLTQFNMFGEHFDKCAAANSAPLRCSIYRGASMRCICRSFHLPSDALEGPDDTIWSGENSSGPNAG